MIARLAEEARLSGAVVHAGTVYLAGQVADDATLDAEGQTADILRQIDALLRQAGTDKRHLLSVQIFLADMADFAAMNRAWDAWLDPRAQAGARRPCRPSSPTRPGGSRSPASPPCRPIQPRPAQSNEIQFA